MGTCWTYLKNRTKSPTLNSNYRKNDGINAELLIPILSEESMEVFPSEVYSEKKASFAENTGARGSVSTSVCTYHSTEKVSDTCLVTSLSYDDVSNNQYFDTVSPIQYQSQTPQDCGDIAVIPVEEFQVSGEWDYDWGIPKAQMSKSLNFFDQSQDESDSPPKNYYILTY